MPDGELTYRVDDHVAVMTFDRSMPTDDIAGRRQPPREYRQGRRPCAARSSNELDGDWP
jgi:hypothetical protein